MPHEADVDEITPGKAPAVPRDAQINNPPEKPVRGIDAPAPGANPARAESDPDVW